MVAAAGLSNQYQIPTATKKRRLFFILEVLQCPFRLFLSDPVGRAECADAPPPYNYGARGAAFLVCPCRGATYVCEDLYPVRLWRVTVMTRLPGVPDETIIDVIPALADLGIVQAVPVCK